MLTGVLACLRCKRVSFSALSRVISYDLVHETLVRVNNSDVVTTSKGPGNLSILWSDRRDKVGTKKERFCIKKLRKNSNPVSGYIFQPRVCRAGSWISAHAN